jgi:hypothetical protein
MKVFRCFFYGFIIVATQSLHARIWVEVGGGIYADKESVTRTGEIAHITVTDMSKDGLTYLKFDCERNIVFFLNGIKPVSTKDNPIFAKTQALACRRSWELWK